MNRPRNPRMAGLPFLTTGVIFVSMSQMHGLALFLGTGLAFLGLGAALLARPRARRGGGA